MCKPGDIIEPEPQGPNDASACRMRRNDRRRKPGGSRHRRTGLNEPFVPPEVYYRVPEYTEQPGRGGGQLALRSVISVMSPRQL